MKTIDFIQKKEGQSKIKLASGFLEKMENETRKFKP